MTGKRRRFLVPEVVQTSAMDCGPATLKALLEGFGIDVNYGRLREACQIDLDGTSIDTMEAVASSVGLDAEQVIVPVDHLFVAEARCGTGIVVVKNPGGTAHFIVLWRTHGQFVQAMDPAVGRRWLSQRELLDQVFLHQMLVPAADWRAFAGSEEFTAPLRARLRALGLLPEDGRALVAEALDDSTWRSIAALDAATRMTRSLVASGAVKRGAEAASLVRSLSADGAAEVPGAYRTASDGGSDEEGEQVRVSGAVLVRVHGHAPGDSAAAAGLSRELAAALAEPPLSPARQFLALLHQSGGAASAVVAGTLALAAAGVVVEALLFGAFTTLSRSIELTWQRGLAVAAFIGFVSLLLLLDVPIARTALRLGRHLELRLRMAFLRKVPRLGDRYFQSRLVSDMAERSHAMDRLRLVPDLGVTFLRTLLELIFTLAGILWLDPTRVVLIVVCASVMIGLPFILLPRLQEIDMRVRSHTGALSRVYLDALLAILPIRTHGASDSVRRQHDALLAEWARAFLSLHTVTLIADATVGVLMAFMTIVILFDHLAHHGLDGGVLLLVFWALRVLSLGHMLILTIATQYPSHRNVALRMLEPLGAPDETSEPASPEAHASRAGGASIRWSGVAVRAASHTILDGIDVRVEAGEHVAIVGRSGAGKSTLVGTILGWHRPAEGTIDVDGQPLDAAHLERMRHLVAWIDPSVQLWNRSLLANLRYGTEGESIRRPLDEAVRAAELSTLLRRLPQGLQTLLGEGGGLVSGGEGQRVRFARALLRPDVRLAILDEPFRGLDREQRRSLLLAARSAWKAATLLCVTHDVGETLAFDRVLVVDEGRIVEDGAPEELARDETTRYRAMLDAERNVRSELWGGPEWRRLSMEHGRLRETT